MKIHILLKKGNWPGGYKIYSLSPQTRVSNNRVPNTIHTDIDNEVANSRLVENQILMIGQAHPARAAQCGDSNFIGPCQ